jgi:CHAT domain-containing protein
LAINKKDEKSSQRTRKGSVIKEDAVRTPPIGLTAALLTALAISGSCRSGVSPEVAFAEAEDLQFRYEKETSRQAISKYQNALAAWRRQGNLRDAARAGQRIGKTYEQLGALHESLQSYLAALTLAQESGEPLLESGLRSDVGIAQCVAAERADVLQEAEGQCNTALTLARASHGSREEAKALNCFGEVAYLRGDLDHALDFYRRAEPLWERLGDRRALADTQLFQGWVHSDFSRFDLARTHFERASALWTSLGDRRGQAITLVADARLRQRRGEYQEALNKFDEALTLLHPMGDVIWEGSSLTGKGTVYLYMAETASALKYWERALQIFEAAGLKHTSIDVLTSLGATYLASGDDSTALTRFERALTLASELGNRRWQAFALHKIGVVHLFRHEPKLALEALEHSLEVQRSVGGEGDPRLEARTRASLGEVYDQLGQYQIAATYFEDALSLTRTDRDRVTEATVLYGLARESVAANDLDGARSHIEAALDVVESLRTEVESRDLRSAYFASVQQYHELHTEILMRLDKRHPGGGLAAAAFEASERARARSLLDGLTGAGVDLRASVDSGLLKREQIIRSAFDEWGKRYRELSAKSAREADTRALAEEYRDLEDRYNQVQAEIRSKSPRYAAVAQPLPSTLKEVQTEILDANTVLLEYALGEDRSYLWSVTTSGYTSYALAPRAEIERSAQRVYALLTTRLTVTGDSPERRRKVEQADAEYWQEAARLSQMVLEPVATKLIGKRILVVTDGALQYLPFAALPIPGIRDQPIPMVVEHEIVNLPSASVLAVLRRETKGRKAPNGAIAVLADPVFESDDPRLQSVSATNGRNKAPMRTDAGKAAAAVSGTLFASGFLRDGSVNVPRLASTRQEADAILAAADGVTLRAIDFDASRATAMSPNLAQYRIVHFATHGVFNNDDPGLSGIILSLFDKRGQPQDGFLRLHDIYGLQLPAELVVLSACNTALGKPVKGEGLVGIVRGFMYAGAKRVVASHWKVDDEATGALMGRFYVEMLKQNRSAAAALRQAQLAVREQQRWQSPFYWAAFVLQGEWK